MSMETCYARVVICTLLLGACHAAKAAAPIIVEDGEARAAIVALPEQTTESDTDVALELQRYIRLITGVTLPIHRGGGPPTQFRNCIVVGKFHNLTREVLARDADPVDLGRDGFAIRTTDDRVILTGNGWNGPYYAMYAWLEALGCRFYSFAEHGEVIPQSKALIAPELNVTSKPRFEYRDFWANGWVKHSLGDDDYARWRSWQRKLRQGGEFLNMSHNFFGFCPPEKYFQSHPEYFALLDGRRANDGQLCLSNPAVRQLAVDSANRFFKECPDVRSYSLVTNDWRGWCECVECRRVGATPELQYAAFVNRLAADLAESHPGCVVTFMPEYFNVPRGRPDAVQFHPSAEPVFVNYFAQFSRLREPLDASGASWLQRLRGWQPVTSRQYVYEWINYSRTGLPSPQWNTIGSRIQAYASLPKLVGYSGEVIAINPETELAIYIGSRLLWDPQADPDAIADEYFQTVYGSAAAGRARAYFEQLAATAPPAESSELRDSAIGTHDWNGAEFWTRSRLAELRRSLETGINQTSDPRQRRNLERLLVYHGILESAVGCCEALRLVRDSPTAERLADARARINEFDQLTAAHAGLTVINRNAVVERYRSVWEEAAAKARMSRSTSRSVGEPR